MVATCCPQDALRQSCSRAHARSGVNPTPCRGCTSYPPARPSAYRSTALPPSLGWGKEECDSAQRPVAGFENFCGGDCIIVGCRAAGSNYCTVRQCRHHEVAARHVQGPRGPPGASRYVEHLRGAGRGARRPVEAAGRQDGAVGELDHGEQGTRRDHVPGGVEQAGERVCVSAKWVLQGRINSTAQTGKTASCGGSVYAPPLGRCLKRDGCSGLRPRACKAVPCVAHAEISLRDAQGAHRTARPS